MWVQKRSSAVVWIVKLLNLIEYKERRYQFRDLLFSEGFCVFRQIAGRLALNTDDGAK